MVDSQNRRKATEKLKVDYDLDACVQWIKDNNYSKVCLQFPELLLNESVDIASFIENQIKQRVYILGDTAYGSCCVDQVACQHVDADAVIHFGHACLSPVSSIPVFYVFPKNNIDTNKFILEAQKLPSQSHILLIYDVSYSHLIEKLRKALVDTSLESTLCISELSHTTPSSSCSSWCALPDTGSHTANTLHRSYCHPSSPFDSVIYIGPSSANFNNMLVYFKDTPIYQYNDESGLQLVSKVDSMKRISYFVEKVKNAENIGIIVATLGIDGYREAIEHVKNLCKLAGKRCYILSVGKPNPAKLANFPEIDVFVAVSCPESDFGDKKTYFQPIVGLFEVDLALNKSRTWGSSGYIRDFRELIKVEPSEAMGGRSGLNTAPSTSKAQEESKYPKSLAGPTELESADVGVVASISDIVNRIDPEKIAKLLKASDPLIERQDQKDVQDTQIEPGQSSNMAGPSKREPGTSALTEIAARIDPERLAVLIKPSDEIRSLYRVNESK